jgi:hypothetical protein
MFKKASLLLLVSTFLLMVPKLFAETSPSFPAGSWEAWIQNTRMGLTLPRPDGKPLMSALPAWVDCHLSWILDRRDVEKTTVKIPTEIILRASPKLCDGQLEQWAR